MPRERILPGKICPLCEQLHSEIEFYKVSGGVYKELGRLPVCKACVNKIFKSFYEQYGDLKKAMQRICMVFDLYYTDKIFDSCTPNADTLMGNYTRMLNMNQYRGKSLDTSLDEGFAFGGFVTSAPKKPKDTKVQKVAPPPEPEEIPARDIEKWGEGFDKVDYDVLNSHYKYLKGANPNVDSNQEIFINDLCFNKMLQTQALKERRIDDYNKLVDSYRRSFKEAGLKTVKETNFADDFVYGVNVETIEKYTPAEYYKNKRLYHDFDNIGEYIERFFLRPLKNLMFGSTDRDAEYYVKEEDSDGGSHDADDE